MKVQFADSKFLIYRSEEDKKLKVIYVRENSLALIDLEE